MIVYIYNDDGIYNSKIFIYHHHFSNFNYCYKLMLILQELLRNLRPRPINPFSLMKKLGPQNVGGVLIWMAKVPNLRLFHFLNFQISKKCRSETLYCIV